MIQSFFSLTAVNASKKQSPLQVDSQGALIVSEGSSSVLNITASTVVKATPGRLVHVSVIVAGSTAGSANDCLTTGAAAVANQFAVIPATAGQLPPFQWPCAVGIVIVPGTGQTLAVSYT